MSSTSSSTRTILGTLANSVFVPPSTCSVLGVAAHTAAVAYQAQQCVEYASAETAISSTSYFYGIGDDVACWPPTTSGVPFPTLPLNGWGVYSPGLICPDGYQPACTEARNTDGSPSLITTGNPFSFYFALNAGETATGCCPTHYSCTSGDFNLQTCISHATRGQTVTVTSCLGATATSTFAMTLPISAASAEIYTIDAYAPMFQLVYQSKDRQAFTITQPTVTVTSKPSPPSGLDTAEKAGIGVGVVVAVLIAIAALVAWFLLRRRRKRRNQASVQQDDMLEFKELPSDGKKSRGEIDGTPLSELDISRPELPGSPLLDGQRNGVH